MATMLKHAFFVFPMSALVILAALVYPREAAITNILLSAPLQVFYLWFACGLVLALVRSSTPWARAGISLLISAPVLVILLRLPVPV